MTIFALVDGNSFYCSAERAFNPALAGRPLVVLSNNDGCVIARSSEAKAIGIKMGEPWHQVERRPECRGVIWRSSNYGLYADMSRRMFEVLTRFSPAVEPYSIDEMFLDLAGMPGDLDGLAKEVRSAVLRTTKIPTCVGLGPSKTIAKLANRAAKADPALMGVCNLLDPARRADMYRGWPLQDVWGIGPAMAARLRRTGRETVADFIAMPPAEVRRSLGVVGARIHAELQGVSCLPLELAVRARKGLAVTRSFGARISAWPDMEDALAAFAHRCGEKLRRQGLAAREITVFMHTSHFASGPAYGGSRSMRIEATFDGRDLVATALRLGRQIWRNGYSFSKAGVMLDDLAPAAGRPNDLFPMRPRDRSLALMTAMDRLNARFGRMTVRSASIASRPLWRPRVRHLSPSYTTRLSDVMKVSTALQYGELARLSHLE